MFRLRALSLLITLILAGCLAPTNPPVGGNGGNIPDTVATAYAALERFHVTPISYPNFTRAGFRAVGISAEVPTSGSPSLQGYNAGTILAAQGGTGALERFIEAGLAAEADIGRFTAYLTPREAIGFTRLLSGGGGIGVFVDFHPQGLVITNVRSGSPAARQGLQIGDIIERVNGQQLTRFQRFDDRFLSLAGEAGEAVNLGIIRGGRSIQTRLVRVSQSVNDFGTPRRVGNVGLIPLVAFDDGASNYIRTAYRQLSAQGALSGLILDLRDNGGGATQQAQEVANLFLPRGTPLFQLGSPNARNTRQTRTGAFFPSDLPVVVLVNGNSASASEIVAAALQDSDRAVLLGSRTFGKGSQQAAFPLPNGGIIAITNAFIYRRTGRQISYVGVTPQICAAKIASGGQMISDLASGSFRSLAAAAAQTSQVSALDRICPSNSQAGNRDVELAALLLGNTQAYNRARAL